MVRRRRLVDAARGFRLAELESARSVVLEPRIGQGGVLPSLAIPRLRLCACAHTSACHARRTTLYVPERCASDALTDEAHTRREYFESESTNGIFRIIAISRRRDFQLSPFGLSSQRSRRNWSAVPRSLPMRCSIINYSSERADRLTHDTIRVIARRFVVSRETIVRLNGAAQ